MSSQFELLKDIDLKQVNRWSAMSCYAAKPKVQSCMISASGEVVCVPDSVPYIDGASAILRGTAANPAVKNTPTAMCMPSFIEPFANAASVAPTMEKCIDGSMAPNGTCVMKK